jgi:class 3 adenylate cyclase
MTAYSRSPSCPAYTLRIVSTAAGPLEEERKVVSVLFADLVGFTARSEKTDPEDVRAVLRGYHGRARAEIERFGGTVEKFVGDAVMAVFGAPVAHEDDAERAVRAALGVAIPRQAEGLIAAAS